MATYENVADELDALINGNHEDDTEEQVADETEVNNEDTDHTETDDTETETNDEAAELSDDTDDGTDEEDEENAPVDNDGSEELNDDDDGTEGEEDENPDDSEDPAEEDSKSDEDSTETEDDEDGSESENTDAVDYQKQYEELLEKSKVATDFYEKVAGVKFKANGKEFEGFKDPKKVIQAQQMAYNYSEKMAGFKAYRPYMGPLKDRGMLDDTGKFDLAMSLIDGDKEALKQHIKNLGIDPVDLDMEDIKYAGESKTSSRDVIAIEDALESAKASGVEDQVYNTVMKEWDDDSFRDFVGNQSIQDDLIAQMADGSYDTVMSKVGQMSVLDSRFSGMKMVDKYRSAINELNSEETQRATAQDTANSVAVEAQEAEAVKVEQEAKVQAEVESKANIEAKAVAAYKAEVNKKKNARAKVARDKANNASKQKPTSSNKRNKVDPMSYNGAEISNFLDEMIMGKK